MTGGFRDIVSPDAARRYREAGWWGDDTVAAAVRRHAAATPSKVAYVSAFGSLTYAELDAAADRVAGALVTGGCAPGARLAVRLPDGPTFHAVLIGAERAGVTVVGIGSRAGQQELEHLVARTGARWFASHASHRGDDQSGVLDVDHHLVLPRVEVDGFGSWPAIDPTEEAARRLGADDLFLINSTSGTTGMPKCVRHHQNRWMFFHRKAVEHGALTPDDVFGAAVPAPFGFGLWTSHVTPLVLGSTVWGAERFEAAAVLDAIEAHRITVLAAVSTQFILLLGDPSLDGRDLSSLRALFTGGEPVPFAQARRFEAATGAVVLQFYGSNESGMLSGTRPTDPVAMRLGTAGRIVPEVEVRLVDGDEDVTASGRGQPVSRGPACAVGYLDDPVADAELFTADGWMRMADVCELSADGYLSVVGRTSDLIIRGGKNISAPTVEAEVATHPAVAHAAAVAVPDDVFGERVGVYVQLAFGAPALTLADLQAHLEVRGVSKETWPEHLAVLPELPLSSGGKVAKGDLRADARTRFR